MRKICCVLLLWGCGGGSSESVPSGGSVNFPMYSAPGNSGGVGIVPLRYTAVAVPVRDVVTIGKSGTVSHSVTLSVVPVRVEMNR